MRSIRIMTGAALALGAVMAQAQAPYAISGLHTDLIFTAAVAHAQQLGGDCQIATPETQDSGASAQCDFAPCSVLNQAGACEPKAGETAGLTLAAQPVLRIVLEAPTASAQLTRIAFVYAGSLDAVAANLKQAFGPPNGNATPADEKSWSHSHRQSWTRGRYRIALLDVPKLIILTVDRMQE